VSIEERELDRLLKLLEDHVDLEHCLKVDERYSMALQYNDVDRPPLVIQAEFGKTLKLPSPWNEFKRYGYREAFKSPVAMLQNMLLDRVVPGVLLKDDSPLAIRNDHGIIQIASVLGGKWEIYEDNYPWPEHFESVEQYRYLCRTCRDLLIRQNSCGEVTYIILSMNTLNY